MAEVSAWRYYRVHFKPDLEREPVTVLADGDPREDGSDWLFTYTSRGGVSDDHRFLRDEVDY